MSSKIPQEIHNLVPEELRDNYGIYWSARSNRYYRQFPPKRNTESLKARLTG